MRSGDANIFDTSSHHVKTGTSQNINGRNGFDLFEPFGKYNQDICIHPTIIPRPYVQ